MMNLDKKCVKRLSKELGHKWGSVYHLVKKFRENLAEKSQDPILREEIEIDQMYYSAGDKGLKKHPIARGLKLRGRGTWDKKNHEYSPYSIEKQAKPFSKLKKTYLNN